MINLLLNHTHHLLMRFQYLKENGKHRKYSERTIKIRQTSVMLKTNYSIYVRTLAKTEKKNSPEL